ncbi:hypothetical protein C8R46DRAFT_1296523 [Mycena filopes]|nr:hypothetical protein C8R46DRAFT_1296523 [Mycena filopes]
MHPSTPENRLNNISKSLTITGVTLELLVDTLKLSALAALSNTTQSLSKLVLTIKQNKEECAELMEHTYQLLNTIIDVYLKSNTAEDLAPTVLNQIGKLTGTLHKIHTFVGAQQGGSRFKSFFKKGELGVLLKNCKEELQHELTFFSVNIIHYPDTLFSIIYQQNVLWFIHQFGLNLDAASKTRNFLWP